MGKWNPESYNVLDIETTLDHATIHGVAVTCVKRGIVSSSKWMTTPDELTDALANGLPIMGHNLRGFDLPVLERVWGWTPYEGAHIIDSLVLSRLANPSRDGGHSLKRLAELAGREQKDQFELADFDGPVTQEMIDYCIQDTVANAAVFEMLKRELSGFDDHSIYLEHEVARLTREQESNGFRLDFPLACRLYNEHEERMNEITRELQAVFPPIVTERWSDKTGKKLKDHVEVFNPASRQQIAKRLESKGVVWKKRTEKGNVVVDETTLGTHVDVPEAVLILEYLTLGKRIGMLRSWLDAVEEDGRIHGRVNTCGAVTGRMTHSSPNMAQIPSDSLYRQCFVVDEGNKLVGVDASGLELRMLAHYMQDPEYTELILHGDIHTYNQELAGLPERNDAKTFIYALLYGAGDAKLGSIINEGARAGARLRQRFMGGLPAFSELVDKVGRISAKGTLPGLDGRRVHVRSEHAALNTLLQSAGAIVMKQALVLATDTLRKRAVPYRLVAQVHDEFQLEVHPVFAEQVGRAFQQAIVDAGVELGLRCPLDGEFMIGDNWSHTH